MTALGLFSTRYPVWTLAGLLIAGCTAPAVHGQVAAKALGAAPAALTAESGKAAPQQGPIRGPMLGYIFDANSHALRPLPGIPGASYVGSPLPVGFAPEFIEVSPSHDYALGVEAATGNLFLIDLRPQAPEARQLTLASAGADRIIYSPLGKAVALYYRESKQIEILAGLPDDASRQGLIGLAGVPGVLTALAVSDDGQTLAAAASQADSGALYVAAPGDDLRPAGPLGRAAALSFLNESQDLLVADAGRNEVILVRNITTGAEWTVLASGQDGLSRPVAVAASRDNSIAFAIDSVERTIAWIPLGGGPVEFLDCPCAPTRLDALAPGSVFRLTSASSAPLYMLDARPSSDGLFSQPRVLFIPAPDLAPARHDEPVPSPRGRVRR
jgi:hypothetical protein